MEPSGDITHLIALWQRGDKGAENALFEALYTKLHGMALYHVRNKAPGQSLGATSLLHDAYVRFRRSERLEIVDRQHFLRLVSRVMHHIVVDRARARLAVKNGGDLVRVDDVEELVQTDADAVEIIAVDEALAKLKLKSARQAQLVELRYFAGYTFAEVGEILGVSEKTAKLDWSVAKGRLQEVMEGAA